MRTENEMVTEFHDCMDQPMNVEISKDKDDVTLFYFRWALIQEEFREVTEAIKAVWQTVYKGNNKEAFNKAQQNLLKELMDLKYVMEGFCITYGYDSTEAFTRVHESNMSKLVDGKVLKDEKGKVMKNPQYEPPNMEDLIPCALK